MNRNTLTLAPAPASSSKLNYYDELTRAMAMLAAEPRSYFIGQAVEYPGTAMFGTLKDVPMAQRLELPVAEEMQMGMAIGLALGGYIPITIYPRWNFLLLATNQLVNHLDKLPLMSKYRPGVIIRTAVGSVVPLDPQHQHRGDYTGAFKSMCDSIAVWKIVSPGAVMHTYRWALDRAQRGESSLVVEVADDYQK